MPKKGSGIVSLDALKKRCIISEISDCWRWQGATIDGHPRVWMFDPLKEKHGSLSGPRALAILTGRRLKRGWRAWMTCQRADCMNPDHLRTGAVATWGAWVAKNDLFKGSPRRISAIRAQWLKRLPEQVEIARIVRSSDETGLALAKRLNVSKSVVSRMRTGQSWVEAVTPFSGLGARS